MGQSYSEDKMGEGILLSKGLILQNLTETDYRTTTTKFTFVCSGYSITNTWQTAQSQHCGRGFSLSYSATVQATLRKGWESQPNHQGDRTICINWDGFLQLTPRRGHLSSSGPSFWKQRNHPLLECPNSTSRLGEVANHQFNSYITLKRSDWFGIAWERSLKCNAAPNGTQWLSGANLWPWLLQAAAGDVLSDVGGREHLFALLSPLLLTSLLWKRDGLELFSIGMIP